MFIVGYRTPPTLTRSNVLDGVMVEVLGQKKYEVIDSLKGFQKFMDENSSFRFHEVWHLLCNFGSDDVTKEVFDKIYAARTDVKTIVENPEFEEVCGEKMEFTIISASPFA